MAKTWAEYKSQLEAFAGEITSYTEELGIDEKVKMLEADHIAIRLNSGEEVEKIKEEILAEGTLISSAVINGRVIYIIELNDPLRFGSWKVPCIELPHPKPNQSYAGGWEHVEFVLPSAGDSLEVFRSEFQKYLPELDIESLRARGIYSEMVPVAEKVRELPNPCLTLEKRKNVTIKFHPYSIKEVVSQ